ncbi:MAG: radical SAM family heme chaperone HemW [Proteobacteria bacterium]|nr:radical SAM family heme chaperone HemW [Pseudomonadota bacterium]
MTTSTGRSADTGLYVHFPWCVKKCPYCDFNSHPLKDALPEAEYLAALHKDLHHQRPPVFSSVFFGGGTPSLFSASTFASLLSAADLAANAEVTMEANPGTAEHHSWEAYLASGINRLSFGAQSFDNAALKRLGRIHSNDETRTCVQNARAAGFTNLNLDLMYGLPQQSTDQALLDLKIAIDLEPDHISWYQLTIEPRTEFAGRPPPLPVDNVIEEMETEGVRLLADADFTRYEVSAYARPGKRCRHNLTYWTFADYLGVGAGAHGMRSGVQVLRTEKPRSPRLYLTDPTHTVTSGVSHTDVPVQFLMNVLRLVDGVPFTRFEEATGLALEHLLPTWQKNVDLGLVQPDRFATTAFGYRHLDAVLQTFL